MLFSLGNDEGGGGDGELRNTLVASVKYSKKSENEGWCFSLAQCCRQRRALSSEDGGQCVSSLSSLSSN